MTDGHGKEAGGRPRHNLTLGSDQPSVPRVAHRLRDQHGDYHMQDEKGRAAHRQLSLSIAMMRADAALAAYERERAKVPERDLTEDEHAQLDRDLLRLENSAFTSAKAHLSIWFAMLYVVIEGWRKWEFSDARVDPLLQSVHVNELRTHRNAVFHAEPFDAPAVMRFVAEPARSKWLVEVSSAIRRALRERNANVRFVGPG